MQDSRRILYKFVTYNVNITFGFSLRNWINLLAQQWPLLEQGELLIYIVIAVIDDLSFSFSSAINNSSACILPTRDEIFSSITGEASEFILQINSVVLACGHPCSWSRTVSYISCICPWSFFVSVSISVVAVKNILLCDK